MKLDTKLKKKIEKKIEKNNFSGKNKLKKISTVFFWKNEKK